MVKQKHQAANSLWGVMAPNHFVPAWLSLSVPLNSGMWVGPALRLWLKQVHFMEHIFQNGIIYLNHCFLILMYTCLSPNFMSSSSFLISLSPLMLSIYAYVWLPNCCYAPPPPHTLFLPPPPSIANLFSVSQEMGLTISSLIRLVIWMCGSIPGLTVCTSLQMLQSGLSWLCAVQKTAFHSAPHHSTLFTPGTRSHYGALAVMELTL